MFFNLGKSQYKLKLGMLSSHLSFVKEHEDERNLLGLIVAYKNCAVSLVSESKMTESAAWMPSACVCAELSQKCLLLTTVKGEYSSIL